jgi:hypothetical protein
VRLHFLNVSLLLLDLNHDGKSTLELSDLLLVFHLGPL